MKIGNPTKIHEAKDNNDGIWQRPWIQKDQPRLLFIKIKSNVIQFQKPIIDNLLWNNEHAMED